MSFGESAEFGCSAGAAETQAEDREAARRVESSTRHPGALLAYLREAVLNRIRTEVRRMATRPTAVDLDEDVTDGGPSPLELAMGRDDLAHYEAALARLRPLYQEAIIARIEMQSSYEEIAQALGKPNANAARSLVVRALYKLYEEMRHGR